MSDVKLKQHINNTEKPTQDWTTGDEAPTGAQLSYIKTMSEGLNIDVPQPTTKAEASEIIDQLQDRSRTTIKDWEIPEGD